MSGFALRNNKGRFAPSKSKTLDVRSPEQALDLEKMIKSGPLALILVYADWCGHCHKYMSTFDKLMNTPGRTANIAKVHHDMLENVPAIKDAKIQGYPSVIRVEPSGKITDYKVPGSREVTNAMPYMRDEAAMKKELKAASNTAAAAAAATPTPVLKGPAADRGEPGIQDDAAEVGDLLAKNALLPQMGGGVSVAAAFMSAIEAAGPAALLLAATSMLPLSQPRSQQSNSSRSRTYKSPKKSSRRGSTRRALRQR